MSSNIGGTATITGNPQNIMIGSFSRIPYGDFAAALAPVAALGLGVALLLLALAWRSEFFTRDRLQSVVPRVRWNGALLAKSLVVALGMVLFSSWASRPPRWRSAAARCCW